MKPSQKTIDKYTNLTELKRKNTIKMEFLILLQLVLVYQWLNKNKESDVRA